MESKKLLGKKFVCDKCGQKHIIETKFLEEGSLELLPLFLKRLFNNTKKLLLLADNLTWEAAGAQCEKNLQKEYSVTPLILSPIDEKRVTSKEVYLNQINNRIELADIIFTVGTGSITDMGKIVGNNLSKPVISFPTAPSMNGYTSPVAAYIKEGLKLTIPVKPALGVFSSPEVLIKSPMELIKSGFADSFAKSFANADWKISSILTGETFCPLPYDIISRSEEKYIDKGVLLLKRDPEVIKNLIEALHLGGISMSIAGKSSPASGGEHLISHFLDMYAHRYSEEIFAYHGLQVGTGVIFSSLLYELMKDLTTKDISKLLNRRTPNYQTEFCQLVSLFPESKKLIEREFREKMNQITLLREKLPIKWEKIKREAFSMVYEPNEIKDLFIKADLPLHILGICPDKKISLDALKLSRFIRGRLTILDLAGETGILEDISEKYIIEE